MRGGLGPQPGTSAWDLSLGPTQIRRPVSSKPSRRGKTPVEGGDRALLAFRMARTRHTAALLPSSPSASRPHYLGTFYKSANEDQVK